MPLLQATLATQLANLTPVTTEATAAATLTDAYITFMSTAQCGPVPIVPASLQTTPKTAMMAALTGMSSAGAGATAIQNGITAFWAAMIPLAATLFPTATVITPPPTLSAIGVALTGIFSSNSSGNLPLVAAANNVATVLYTNSIGGTATLVLPPPTPTPIL